MSQNDNIHAGHKQRMRERFEKNGGFHGFSDHEILEVLLNYANIRTNTNTTAHLLINKFGSLNAVFEASREELLDVPGVGPTTATLIIIQRELFSIYSRKKHDIKHKKYRADDESYIEGDFYRYISSLFPGNEKERLYVLCVNAQGRIRKATLLGEGTSDTVIINQKELLKIIVNCNATGVILVHNHVTGVVTPSNADIENTKCVQKILDAVEVKLIDHFVVTDNDCTSILKDPRYRYMK